MASTINGTSTGSGGLISTGDDSGILNIQTNETTAITVDASQRVAFVAGTAALPAITTVGDTNTGIFFPAADTIAFAEGGAEAMRIESSGSVGIGVTPDTNYFLTVQSTSNDDKNAVKLSQGSTALRTQISFNNPNGQVGTIQTNGSTTSYNTSSDYRLKDNVQPMTGALAKVALLKPVTYKWKVDGSDGEGFIAHELAEVKPDCVSGEKDAVDANGNPVYQGIDVSFLVATLTAALQETKALIDQQAETINALTARVVALESRGTV